MLVWFLVALAMLGTFGILWVIDEIRIEAGRARDPWAQEEE